MYVAIRRYQIVESGSVDEVLQRVRDGFIPIIRDGFIPIIKEGPGFLAYYVLDSGGRHGYFGKHLRGPRGGRSIDQRGRGVGKRKSGIAIPESAGDHSRGSRRP